MADIHIEDFYKDTALILLQLYLLFPRKTSVYVEDIAGPDAPDEFGLHSPRHMACFGAMLWLADEGHLRYEDTIRQEAIDQAVLTRESFVRLSSLNQDPVLKQWTRPPETAPETVRADYCTNVHLLREAVRDGHSSRISETVRRIFFVPD